MASFETMSRAGKCQANNGCGCGGVKRAVPFLLWMVDAVIRAVYVPCLRIETWGTLVSELKERKADSLRE